MVFILIGITTIIFVDVIPLIKKKQWADLIICALISLLACSLFIAKDFGIVPLKSLSMLLNGIGEELFG